MASRTLRFFVTSFVFAVALTAVLALTNPSATGGELFRAFLAFPVYLLAGTGIDTLLSQVAPRDRSFAAEVGHGALTGMNLAVFMLQIIDLIFHDADTDLSATLITFAILAVPTGFFAILGSRAQRKRAETQAPG